MICHFLLAYLLVIGLAESSSQGPSSRRNGNNGASFSPVRELGPSLAASVAGGTIIAARSPLSQSLPTKDDGEEYHDHDDCLVVLFRSPITSDSGKRGSDAAGNLTVTSVFASEADDNEIGSETNNNQHHRDNYYDGLTFLPNGAFPFLPSSSSSNNVRILHAPSGLLVAATGFAPDAEHILNVAAGRVFSRISLFDAPSSISSSSGSKSVDPHRLVREDLSSMMIDAALSDGGRPLGVQLLVVGQSALSQREGNDYSPLDIYTIDPSGGWRNCVGRGTAVGRGAERVRSSMFHATNTESGIDRDKSRGWRGALDRAMMAAVDALEKDENSDNDLEINKGQSAQYGAVVIFAGSNVLKAHTSTSRCASINAEIVQQCYSRCCDRARQVKLSE